jgi:hypothetical protein
MNDVFVTKITEPEMYIDLHLIRDRFNHTITLDQALYIQKKILDQYGFQDCHTISTPADPSSHLQPASNSQEIADDPQFPFINIVGNLQFATITTRAEISYATSIVAAYKRHPSNVHCNVARRIIKYLKETKHLKITFGGHAGSSKLEAYADSDYATNHDDRKSRTGYIIYFNGGPVSWGSKKKSCVATSTTHAEYMALYSVTKEVIWCRRLLSTIGEVQTSPTVIYCDSQSAMRLALNPEFHASTKHIDIKFHYTRNEIIRQSIYLKYINTSAQIADILTKAIIPYQFRKLRTLILTDNDGRFLRLP